MFERKSASVSRLPSHDTNFTSRAAQRSPGPTTACNLCGSVGAVVECEKCQSMAFCSTCDDMYHRHPKRRFHLRRSLLCEKTTTQTRSGIDLRSIAGKIFSKSSNETRPALNASFSGLRESAAHPSKMPIPPPRRKKKDATLQRAMIPSLMQKFGSSNFRRFQMNDNSQKNAEMQAQQTNVETHSQRLPVRALSVHQISAPFEEPRRSSYQSSLTGSDVSADPWSQDSQFDCIPPPLPQKMRSSQMVGRRNLSLTDLYDQCQEPQVNAYYGYPQPHFMPPWMHSSLSHSIDDFGDDDDQNSVSEFNERGTLTRNGQGQMRRTQSYMQMNPWAMQYPPYYYPPYPSYYPPPPPQFYRSQPSPTPSLRSLSIRRQREDDRGSNVSVSVRDSASVRSENITKSNKSKVKSKPKIAKSLVDMKIAPNVYKENRRSSTNSVTHCLSDSEGSSENESEQEVEEEEEEEEEKYASFSDAEEDEETSSYGSLVDLKTEWTCKYCTFVNRPERDICEICAKSHRKRIAIKTQLEEQNMKNEAKTVKKEEPMSQKASADVTDANIVITKEMILEQKRVEREIRRRILNEKRIAKENERLEKRQKERRKTLGSLEEREKVSEAVNAINQKTKSEEKIEQVAASATIDKIVNAEAKPDFSELDQSTNEASQEEVKKKKKVKKSSKKAADNNETTQALLKDTQEALINKSELVAASANESLSKTSSNEEIMIEQSEQEKATITKNNECVAEPELKHKRRTQTQASDSINQTQKERNPSETQIWETIHRENKRQEIKTEPLAQIATHVETYHMPQSPQPQQSSPQTFTPPPTFPQQMNVPPLNMNAAQTYQYTSQPQLCTYQDVRRSSLGSLPYSHMNPSYSLPNPLDLQVNNQYISPPPQFVGSLGSMNRIDVTGSMNGFSPIGSPVDNYLGITQPMLQNNFGQRFSSSMGNMKTGFEMLKVLREAEKKGFTAEDVEIAFNFSPENAMEWLEINWSNMVETVLTLGNNQVMQNEKKRGVTKKALLKIPLITESEAKEALRNARGNIWQAIEKCVQQKEEKRQTVDGKASNAKSFTLKISELGAGRDNFEQNTQRMDESLKADQIEESERLAKIEEMFESWKKELIEGKKCKDQFLNTIEDLVKKKIAFIDETLARRKRGSLEENLRKRFIEEFFSDEELDENIFVREDTINVVDGQGNVVCVKDAYKDAISELSKEEIAKKLRDKGFFIGDEKRADEQVTAASTSVQDIDASLQQSLEQLHSLDTNERTAVIDSELTSDQNDTHKMVAYDANCDNENKTEAAVTPLSEANAAATPTEQSVGDIEDKFEDAKEHVAADDYKTVDTEDEIEEEILKDETSEDYSKIVDLNQNIEIKIEEPLTFIDEDDIETVANENDEAKTEVIVEENTATPSEEVKGPPSTKLPRKTYECELCAGSFRLAEMVTMPSCDHSACIECLQQYFTVQIREKQKVIIPCPYCNQPEINADDEDEICNYLSILDQLLKVLLPEDLHELFQRKVRDRTLQKDPSFRWCPQCSSGFLACDPNAKTITCPDCKTVTCSQCKSVWQKQHIGLSCEKFAEWKKANDPKFAEQFIDSHLRQFGIDCPQCKFHYELSRGGCIHFHCVQCGHDFCGFCQMPFKMGDKCSQSEWCKKLGFHAHHPRNCLFYLRDRDVNDLKRLLDMHKIKYDRKMKDSEKSKSKKCPVMEQKWKIGEPQAGLIDASCGKEMFADGVCKSHYVEYLTELIRENKVDPVDILDEDEMVHLLRRANLKIPIKINPKQHIINLRQVIQEELPLC